MPAHRTPSRKRARSDRRARRHHRRRRDSATSRRSLRAWWSRSAPLPLVVRDARTWTRSPTLSRRARTSSSHDDRACGRHDDGLPVDGDGVAGLGGDRGPRFRPSWCSVRGAWCWSGASRCRAVSARLGQSADPCPFVLVFVLVLAVVVTIPIATVAGIGWLAASDRRTRAGVAGFIVLRVDHRRPTAPPDSSTISTHRTQRSRSNAAITNDNIFELFIASPVSRASGNAGHRCDQSN